LKIITDKAI